MTTPATFSQPLRIIQYAYVDAGLLPEGELPSSEKIASAMNRLNDLINLWGTQGLKLWTYVEQAISLVAGVSSYTLGPGGTIITTKPLRAIQGFYQDSNNVRRPLYPLSWEEWMRLSQVNSQGQISQFHVDKQVSNLVVRFWLTPDATAATGSVHLLLPRQITNFTGLTDSMNFPQEWFMGLRWGLADELAVGQPLAIMQRCAERAHAYRTMLEDWDVEDATVHFQPDDRRGNVGSMSFL